MEKLNLLCRVCGERSKESKVKSQPKQCESYSQLLAKYHNINVNEDIDGVHSKTLCRKCYTRFAVMKSRNPTGSTLESVQKDIERSSVLWQEYNAAADASSCIVCSTYDKQKKGGRQNKVLGFKPTVSTSVPDVSITVHDDTDSIDTSNHDATSVFFPPSTSTPLRKTSVAPQEPCASTSAGSDFLNSPVTPLKPPPPMHDLGTSPLVKVTVRDIDQITFPLNNAEEKLFTAMVKIKLENSKDKKSVVCKTGGQEILLRKIVKPRKGSASVRTPLRKRRAREEKELRKEMSGQLEEDSIKQMATGIKTTKAKTARKVLDLAGHGKTNMSAKEMVIFQNEMGYSNRKGRVVSKTLRKKGVKVPSEKEVKDFKDAASSGDIITQNTTVLEYHGPDIAPTPKDVPVTKVSDLVEYVNTTLYKLADKVCLFILLKSNSIVIWVYNEEHYCRQN